ncbi:hypothetical protein ACFUJY_30595 [Streptomyces sp. NPDC057249]|uniref:hypothetical protein n=1 Tax=Streptomyces sp. NPDC057249 TaxID=3346067 RepID=UPI003644E4D5
MPEQTADHRSVINAILDNCRRATLPYQHRGGVDPLRARRDTSAARAVGHTHEWAWATDEITDGIAAKEQDTALLGDGPVPAYALGHDVGPDRTQREQAVVVGEIVRCGEGRGFVWSGHAPRGCAGAPVFVGLHLADRSFRLVCLGVLLPGEGEGDTAFHRVATFDRIRTAVRGLPRQPAAGAATPAPARWWRRQK